MILVEDSSILRAGLVRLLADAGHDVVADPVGARERIAAVEQRTFLFLGSIADNLRVAAPDAPDARLWEALELAGLRQDDGLIGGVRLTSCSIYHSPVIPAQAGTSGK